jgi:hypothetical protein
MPEWGLSGCDRIQRRESAMSKRTLRDLGDRLQAIMENWTEGPAPSTADLVAALRKRHGRLITEYSRELENRALTKLVSDVANRKSMRGNPDQPDLFLGYSGIPNRIMIGGRKNGHWQRLPDTTIGQMREFVNEKNARKRALTERDALAELLADLEAAGAKPTMTVAEAIKKFQHPG